jgi:hypothetical protein
VVQAIAVASSRKHEAEIFGQAFDRLIVTTPEDVEHNVAGPNVSIVGIAGDARLSTTLAWALALLQERPGIEIAIDMLADASNCDGIFRQVEEAGVRCVELRRFGDRPCMILAESLRAGDSINSSALCACWNRTFLERQFLASELGVASEWELAVTRKRLRGAQIQVQKVSANSTLFGVN